MAFDPKAFVGAGEQKSFDPKAFIGVTETPTNPILNQVLSSTNQFTDVTDEEFNRGLYKTYMERKTGQPLEFDVLDEQVKNNYGTYSTAIQSLRDTHSVIPLGETRKTMSVNRYSGFKVGDLFRLPAGKINEAVSRGMAGLVQAEAGGRRFAAKGYKRFLEATGREDFAQQFDIYEKNLYDFKMDIANEMRKTGQQNKEFWTKGVAQSVKQSFVGQAVEGLGELPMFVFYAIPPVGLAVTAGRYYNEGFDESKTAGFDDEKAHKVAVGYTSVFGSIGVLVDKFTLGIGNKALKGMQAGTIGKTIVKQGGLTVVHGTKAGLTEFVTETAESAALQKVTTGDVNWKQAGTEGALAFITGAIGGSGAGVTRITDAVKTANKIEALGFTKEKALEVANNLVSAETKEEVDAIVFDAVVTPILEGAGVAEATAGDIVNGVEEKSVVEQATQPATEEPVIAPSASIWYRGTAEPIESFDGAEYFSDSKDEASGYAELAALKQLVESNDDLSQIVSDVLAEQGGEYITDLSPKQIHDIIEANDIDVEITNNKGSIAEVELMYSNPIDLTILGSALSGKKSIRDAWNFLVENGLINDSKFDDFDIDVQEDIIEQYRNKAIYTLFDNENIYSKAFDAGYDAVIFTDQGVTGTSTHKTALVKDRAQIKKLQQPTKSTKETQLATELEQSLNRTYTKDEAKEISKMFPNEQIIDRIIAPSEQRELFKKMLRGDEAARKQFNQNNEGVADEVVEPTVEEEQDSTPEEQEQTVLEITKESNIDFRREMELEDLNPAQIKEQILTITNAKKKNLSAADVNALADDIMAKNRSVTDEEVGAMLIRKLQISKEINEAIKLRQIASNSKDQNAFDIQNAKIIQLKMDADKLTRASVLAGTNTARALASFSMKLDAETFDLVAVREKAVTIAGRDLTQEEETKIEDGVAKVEEKQKAYDEVASQQKPDTSEEAIAESKRIEELSTEEQIKEVKDGIDQLNGMSDEEFAELSEEDKLLYEVETATRIVRAPKKTKEQKNAALKLIRSRQDKIFAIIEEINGRKPTKEEVAKVEQPDSEGYLDIINNLKGMLAEKKAGDRKVARNIKLIDKRNALLSQIENLHREVKEKADKKEKSKLEQDIAIYEEARRDQDIIAGLLAQLRGDVQTKTTVTKEDVYGYKQTIKELRKQISDKKYTDRLEKEVAGLERQLETATRDIKEPAKTPKEKTELEKRKSVALRELKKQDAVFNLLEILRKHELPAVLKKANEDPNGYAEMAKNLRKEIRESQWHKDLVEAAKKDKRYADRLFRLEQQLRHLEDQFTKQYRDIPSEKRKIYGEEQVWLDSIRLIKQKMRIADQLADANENIRLISDGQIDKVLEKFEKKNVATEDPLAKERAELKRAQDEVRRLVWAMRDKTIFDKAGEVADFIRATTLAADIGAIGRQGGKALLANPILSYNMIKASLPAVMNDENFYSIAEQMQTSKFRKDFDRWGLEHMDIDGTFEAHQEAMNSKLAEKLPWVKFSNRHMITYLNLLRDGLMTDFVTRFPDLSDAEYSQYAKFVNEFTGRGTLGVLENSARGLSRIFLAPRWVASNLQSIAAIRNAWVPDGKGGKQFSPIIAKEIAKEWAKFWSFWAGLAALFTAIGFEVGIDPEEGDFLKFRKDDLVIDLTGGFASNLRIPVLMAESLSARMGVGDMERNTNLYGVIGRYLGYKTSPLVQIPLEFFAGKTIIGKERNILEQIAANFMPLVTQQIYEGIKEDASAASILSATALETVGVGAQIYEKKGGSGIKKETPEQRRRRLSRL